MSAELDPFIELFVIIQKSIFEVSVNDECGSGDVSRFQIVVEACLMGADELDNLKTGLFLVFIEYFEICEQTKDEFSVVHVKILAFVYNG